RDSRPRGRDSTLTLRRRSRGISSGIWRTALANWLGGRDSEPFAARAKRETRCFPRTCRPANERAWKSERGGWEAGIRNHSRRGRSARRAASRGPADQPTSELGKVSEVAGRQGFGTIRGEGEARDALLPEDLPTSQ